MSIVVPYPPALVEETSASEMDVQKRLTRVFIAENPTDIAIQRSDITSDGAGGRLQNVSSTLDPQVFRVVGNNRQITTRRTVDGQEVDPEYVLIGEYDADIRTGDWFLMEGIKYEVVHVRLDHRYETWAEVAWRG